MPNAIATYIDFIATQLPGLKSGDYSVTVDQTIEASGVNEKLPQARMEFSIRGDRFTLKPSDIASVFPPPGSLGKHSGVLPQVVLKRNTLPWERMLTEKKPGSGDDEEEKVKKFPWMALLVFNEGELDSPDNKPDKPVDKSEIEQGAVMSLDEFFKKDGISGKLKIETDENVQDKLSVIYAPQSLLKQLLMPASALAMICHARESSLRLELGNTLTQGSDVYYEIYEFKDEKKGQLVHAAHQKALNNSTQIVLNPGELRPGDYTVEVTGSDPSVTCNGTIKITSNDEFGHKVAIVAANRLPKPGARSIVHLVSLEQRYHWGGEDYVFEFGSDDKALIPLVTLKSWSFDCVEDGPNFNKILENVIEKGKGDSESTLRLPLRAAGQDANNFLKSGYVPLPHYFREGSKSVSWYRGPLAPGVKTATPMSWPAPCADALLIYHEDLGMFDVSYAAAWELGRLLALRNKKFSTGLYRWKRLNQQKLLLAEQQELHPHLPFHKSSSPAGEMPEELDNWFSQVSLLKGVPFNYLVPDEKMLPAESIRFFHLDSDWIASLMDGAFSVGPVTSGKTQALIHLSPPSQNVPSMISGFLLRSYAVSGWPDLQITGYSKMDAVNESTETPAMEVDKLKIMRLDYLSPNILLCLFEGEVKAVDIYLKPEMLHLGFDLPKDDGKYTKDLRNALSNEKDENDKPFLTEILTFKYPDTRIVDVGGLFGDIQNNKASLNFNGAFTSAQFALSLMDGAQKVRFIRD